MKKAKLRILKKPRTVMRQSQLPTVYSREVLLEAVKCRDLTMEEFNDIVIYYTPMIKLLTFRSFKSYPRFTVSYSDLEEEAWVAFIRVVKEYHHKAKPGLTFTLYAWMRCRSRLMHVWRREHLRIERTCGIYLDSTIAPHNTEKEALTNLVLSDVSKVMKRLTPQQREVIRLTIFQDLNLVQAAAVIGISWKTVNALKSHGLKRLRYLLNLTEENYRQNETQKTFINPHGKQLKILIIQGEPWFVAKDVCECAGYHRSFTARLPQKLSGEMMRWNPVQLPGHRGETQTQSILTISEEGVNQFVRTSVKVEAAEFLTWISQEVIPNIYKSSFALSIKRIK